MEKTTKWKNSEKVAVAIMVFVFTSIFIESIIVIVSQYYL